MPTNYYEVISSLLIRTDEVSADFKSDSLRWLMCRKFDLPENSIAQNFMGPPLIAKTTTVGGSRTHDFWF